MAVAKPSALLDTRVVYCGDNLDQLKNLPERCADLIYIDPPFISNRNYEVFWGETKEKCAFETGTRAPAPDRQLMHTHRPRWTTRQSHDSALQLLPESGVSPCEAR